MDPQTDLPSLTEDLEVNIDELTTTLTPLLPPNTLSKTAKTLPLLEKAKLHILTAYAIESLLYSTLQASGSDAKSHAIFTELARLKTYFSKIKAAEEYITKGEEKRAKLDVEAAGRFIRHGLAGNQRFDELRRERERGERERAVEKARKVVNVKFGDEEERGTKRAVEAEQDAHVEDVESTVDNGEAPPRKKRGRPAKKDKAVQEATPQKDTPTRATRSSAAGESLTAEGSGSPGVKAKGRGKGRGRK